MRLSGRRMNQLITQGWNQIREEQSQVPITSGSVWGRKSMEGQSILVKKRRIGRPQWAQVAAVLVFGIICVFTLTGYRQSKSSFSFTRNDLNQMKIQLIPDDFKELKL